MISKIRPNTKNKNVGVITTSSPIDFLDPKQIEKGYKYLENKGFHVVESHICRKRKDYTSGSIKERVEVIHNFIKNPEIDIIMSFWGGTNTNQLLPYIDYELIKNNPKVFVGYSDTSALLTAITTKTNVITFHGPSVITYSKPNVDEYSFEYFKKAIDSKSWFIKEPENFADDLYFLRKKDNDRRILKKNEGIQIFRKGSVKGEVLVSNLQTLLVLAGTDYFPILKDKILFLEEAEDENAQMIDRFFTHLSQLKEFGSIKGLVVGKFMENSEINNKQIKNILSEVSNFFDGPIVFDASFGHTDPIFTIPNGGLADINTSRKNIIRFSYE